MKGMICNEGVEALARANEYGAVSNVEMQMEIMICLYNELIHVFLLPRL